MFIASHSKSPLFVGSLDAEKCFDRIWHSALFLKLWGHLDKIHWRFMFTCYSNLQAMVRWNGQYSASFQITRGTRQGSLLSPMFFNIFIDDLLKELKKINAGFKIGNFHVNSFAYADDLTLISSTTSGLQCLIDTCQAYATKWRFSFGIKKSVCMTMNSSTLQEEPKWYLGDQLLTVKQSVNILGVSFDAKNNPTEHINERISRCRRAFYGLVKSGITHTLLDARTKMYMWQTMCVPSLTYGCESLHLRQSDIHKLESLQGCMLKQCVHLPKRNHHTPLVQALSIPTIKDRIQSRVCGLLHGIYSVPSPARDLCVELMAQYVATGFYIPGTLVGRVVDMGISPARAAFNQTKWKVTNNEDGLIDSLRSLLFHDNYMKPWSDERMIVSLLTKSF